MMDREEWQRAKLKEAEEADPTRVVGKATALTLGDRQYRAIQPAADGKVKPGTQLTEAFQLPDIKKRTEQERALSLASRLWRAAKENPQEMQLLLQNVQSELWQKGRPVPFDEIRKLADQLMEAATKKEDEKYFKMVSH